MRVPPRFGHLFLNQWMNENYFKYHKDGIPFVTLKIAQTLDGKISSTANNSRWITCLESRKTVHKMRRESDTVLVGVDTVIKDDPQLNVRLVKGRNPRRVVLDSHLRIPQNAKILQLEDTQNTIIATTEAASQLKIDRMEKIVVSQNQIQQFLKDGDLAPQGGSE